MITNVFYWSANLFLLLYFSLLSHNVAYSLDLPITVHGEVKVLELTENVNFSHESPLSKHYKGHVKGEESDWVRISQLSDGTWSGIVFSAGEMHFVENQKPENDQAMESTALSLVAEHPSCGVDHQNFSPIPIHPHSAAPPTQSALFVPEAISAGFASICAGNIVDGVCVFSDLELVLDQEYQNEFSSDIQGNTNSLINMVEGYYLNQFNIAFNVINQVLLTDSTDIYTNSNDASTLLSDIYSRRCEQQMGAANCRASRGNYDGLDTGPSTFIDEDDSIVHILTGRNFDGSTIGIAFLDAFCGEFAVGVSSLVRDTFTNAVSLSATAAVIAHEIGHNFGAEHDGEGMTPANATSCPANGFIMSATLGSTIPTEFSSCSEEVITQTMATNINNSCATAPVDIVINPGSFSSTVSISESVVIDDAFTVARSQIGFRNTGVVEIIVSSSGAIMESVTIEGNGCTILAGNQQAICSLSAGIDNSTIDITASPFSSAVNISAVDRTNTLFKDTDRSNSNASFDFIALDEGLPPPSPPEPEEPNEESPSSNSGGALDYRLLFILVFLMLIRRRI